MASTSLDNIQISGLTELSNTDHLLSNDFLMISEQTSQTIFTSKKVNLSSLYSDINRYFTNVKDITFNANIKFQGNLSITTEMIDNEIENNNYSVSGCHQLINFEYAKKEFLDPFYKLSSTIYEEIQLPSYVGQIIYSTTLNRLTKVKNYYGKNTEWKQICGRFILGVEQDITSELSAVDKYGGEISHKLTLDELPAHIHTIDPSTEEKELTGRATLTSEDSAAKIGVNSESTIQQEDDLHSSGTNSGYFTLGCVTRQNKPDAAPNVAYVSIFGNNGPNNDIKVFGDTKCTHNNMPPFITMYIWERIA